MLTHHHHLRARRGGLLLLCVLAIGAPSAFAQAPPATITLDGLQTPPSPAFTLLGVSPTTIDRPTTPQGIAFNLLAAAVKSDSLIPSDYALEVAPYWLKNRPNLSYNTYFAPKTTQSIAQTLSFSFVTSKPANTPTGTTDIGFGARTSIRAGHASLKVRNLLKSLASDHIKYQILDATLERVTAAAPSIPASAPTLPANIEAILDPSIIKQSELTSAEIAAIVTEMRKALLQTWATAMDRKREPTRLMMEGVSQLLSTEPTDPVEAEKWRKARDAMREQLRVIPQAMDTADIVARLKEKLTALETSFSDTSRRIQAEDKIRRGFILSVAGAVASRVVADGGLRDADYRGSGLWVTSAYRTDGPLIDFIAMARVVSRPAAQGDDVYDFGAQFVHQPGQFVWAAEYVQRVEKGDAPTTQRLGVNFEYKLRDNVILSAAFGKDFANPSAGRPKGGLVSVLGVNVGFSAKSAVKIVGVPAPGN
jgi:hypothetical protein